MQLNPGLIGADDISATSVFTHFVADGGWITWFVLIPLSVVTIALVIHYMLTIRRSAQLPADMARALVQSARQRQANTLLEACAEDDSMLAQAAFAGLSQMRSGVQVARAAVDESVDERATKLMRRIEYLNVIGNVSPMIGLLGTVLGMIQAFSRIFAAGGGMPEPGKLAGDIAVALVTTFWGILVAIPALTAYSLFRNQIDAFAAECAKFCDGLIAILAEAEATAAAEPMAVTPAPASNPTPPEGVVQAPGPVHTPAPANPPSTSSPNVAPAAGGPTNTSMNVGP